MNTQNNKCPNCQTIITNETTCPNCGYDLTANTPTIQIESTDSNTPIELNPPIQEPEAPVKKSRKKGWKIFFTIFVILSLLIAIPLLYLNFAQIENDDSLEETPTMMTFLSTNLKDFSSGAMDMPYAVIEKELIHNIDNSKREIAINKIMIDGLNQDLIVNVSGEFLNFIPIKTSLLYDIEMMNTDNNLGFKLSNLRLGKFKIPVSFIEQMIDISNFDYSTIKLPKIYALKDVAFYSDKLTVEIEYDEENIVMLTETLINGLDSNFINELSANKSKLIGSKELIPVYKTLDQIKQIKANKNSSQVLELLNGNLNYLTFLLADKRENFTQLLAEMEIPTAFDISKTNQVRQEIEDDIKIRYEAEIQENLNKFAQKNIKFLFEDLYRLKTDSKENIILENKVLNIIERKIYEYDTYVKNNFSVPKNKITFNLVSKEDHDYIYVNSEELGHIVYDHNLNFKKYNSYQDIKKEYTIFSPKWNDGKIRIFNLGTPEFEEQYRNLLDILLVKQAFVKYIAFDGRYSYVEYYDSSNMQYRKIAIFEQGEPWKLVLNAYEYELLNQIREKQILQQDFNPYLFIYKLDKYNNLNQIESSIKDIHASSYLTQNFQGDNYYQFPENLLDGNAQTYWSEGVEGYGLEQSITIDFKEPTFIQGLDLLNGCAKSEKMFVLNGSVKTVEITLDNGVSEKFELINDYKVVNSLKLKEPQYTRSITLKIMDTYPGENFENTILSEIMFKR